MKKWLSIVVLIVVGSVGFTMWQYSRDTGRQPWEWTGTDWNDWMTFTKRETEQLGMQAKQGGEATWLWVGENTPALFEKSKALLARLGHQETQGSMEQPPSAALVPEPMTRTPTAGVADRSTDPLDIRSANYKYGKEWLGKGIAEWQVSLIHPGAAERAKANFEKAIRSFEAAKAELDGSAGVDVAQLEQNARDYLADTEERLQQIRQSGE